MTREFAREESNMQKMGSFALAGIDKILHERARLSVLAALMANSSGLHFQEISRLCGLSHGNLGGHLRILQHAGVIVRENGIPRGKIGRPPTTFRLTASGEARFRRYLKEIEYLLSITLWAEHDSRL